jgi:nucleoside-diphosphate-sugar epimerase
MKTVLITGGNGYLGSSCVELFLKKKYFVIVVDAFFSKINHLNKIKKNKKLKIYKEKTENLNKFLINKKIDYLIHCANLVGDEACYKNKKFLDQINYKDTKFLLNFCEKNKIKTFIYPSTCSNYGFSTEKKSLTEKSKLNPTGIYAMSKIKSELEILKFKNNISKNIILRLGTLYGVSLKTRFDLLINDIVRAVYYKEKIEIYSPYSWRPYIHVSEAARAIEIICRKANSMKDCFNVCSFNIQKLNLVNKIKKYLNSSNVTKINLQNKGNRDYKVSSNKIIIKYKIKFKKNLRFGVNEIYKMLRSIKIKNSELKKNYNALYKVK